VHGSAETEVTEALTRAPNPRRTIGPGDLQLVCRSQTIHSGERDFGVAVGLIARGSATTSVSSISATSVL
jgi:hypothetical protein